MLEIDMNVSYPDSNHPLENITPVYEVCLFAGS